MKVIHTISGIRPSGGGPSVSVPKICHNLHQQGVDVTLATVGQDDETLQAARSFEFECFTARSGKISKLCSSKELFQYLLQTKADIIHDQAIWELPPHYGAVAARKRKIPYLLTPRGMLEPWALGNSKWKKKIISWLFVKEDLKQAACLHATAVQEYGSIRAYGLTNPVAIIPNGVDVSDCYCDCDRNSVNDKWPELSNKKIMLFMSRVHPKKGLLNLAKVWGKLAHKYRDWHLVIAGPDQNGHEAEVRAAINKAGVLEQTTFTGPVYDDLKKQLYAACGLFVLPTFSENFGIVIAEALASGKPVITTKGTPWQELETHNCGWWIDIGVEPLEAAITAAMNLSDDKRVEMGMRGRKLIQDNYSWPKIAQQMIDVYNWVLGKGDKPDCVRLD